MYCSKCGSELEGNEKYCSKCGANIRDTEKQISNNLHFLIAVLLGLNCIFAAMPIYKVSTILELNVEMGFSDYEGLGLVLPVTVIIHIISIISILYPVILKKIWKPVYMLPSKITACWTMFWFLLILNLSIGTAGEYGNMAHISLTVVGWFMLALTLAIIILSFKLPDYIKNIKFRR